MPSLCCKQCMLAGGIGFAVAVGVLAIMWPTICTTIIENNLILTPKSLMFKMWKDTPIPIRFEVYLFNLTNHEEFLANKSVKLEMDEVGPFVFSQQNNKKNIEWNEWNDTISFRQYIMWHFESDKTNVSLDDIIINFNPIAVSVSYIVRKEHMLIKRAVDWLLNDTKQSLIVTKTAGEQLFDGYDNDMLSLGLMLNVSGVPDIEKFAWFVGRNNTGYAGLYNMYTGRNNISLLGMLDRWKGQTESTFYGSPCNKIQGSLGDLWSPRMNNADNITLFSPDLCASLTLEYDGPYDVSGIQGMRFRASDRLFDNGSRYPEMDCFSSFGDKLPSGVMNVSKCTYSVPGFVSLPHFNLADPVYRDAIGGMVPDPEKHTLSIVMEPTLGVPLIADAPIQVNLLIQENPGIVQLDGIKKPILVPMLWFRQIVSVPDDLAGKVKLALFLPDLGYYVLLGISIIIFIVTLSILVVMLQRRANIFTTKL